MLDPVEAASVAEQFGVSDTQVRRDHLLSHLLAALAGRVPDRVVFFGGTALARTHLPEGRLSEDLDLWATSPRSEVVSAVQQALADGVRREYGRLTWDPPLSEVRDVDPATLRNADGLRVRVQLLDVAHYPPWPTERARLVQRYSDAPPASLTVPTLPAFAAAKTVAWHDRHAPRDLYDLWGLAQIGALNTEAAALFAALGPTGQPPAPWMFERAPTQRDWVTELAAQTRLTIEPEDALRVVREAWTSTA